MQELWSSTSYEPHLLSLPFAFAPAAMSMVIAYALVMRGAPQLRLWLSLHFASLFPYSIAMALSPSITSPAAATALFKLGAAFVPLAAATGAGFQLALLGERRGRIAVWAAVLLAVVWIVIGATTDKVVTGVRWLPAGFWYAEVGPWAYLALLTTFLTSLPSFLTLTNAAITRPPSDERRQLRATLAANLITYAGLTDVLLAYHIGVFPAGWLLSGIGSLLVVRALVVDDLLRVRAVDTRAPLLVLHFAGGLVLGSVVLSTLGRTLPWWVSTVGLVLSFGAVRVTIAVFSLISRGARGGEGTLDRLLAQLVGRARALISETEVAQLAIDVVELGIGARPRVLLAAAEDWGWTTETGARVDDADAPDPLLVGWLAEQTTPIFANEIETRAPEDLRPMLAALFDRHGARPLMAVRSGDELVALVMVPSGTRRLRGRELQFLASAGDRLGEALVYARMAQRAAERAAIAREVELAATVQKELLPGGGPHVHGDLTLIGSWLPATRCAGDFWGAFALGDGRVLVAIGDVTGHGVASAMVTAAAVGACDVAVRRFGTALALGDLIRALDAAVHRVGGGQLSMTCAAAIFDPATRALSFVSCGHTTPYVCRLPDGKEQADLELVALVARGNLLGSGNVAPPKVQERTLRAGDLIVWYTDGVVEAQNPDGKPFGDRGLQRLLRRIDRDHMTPSQVHELVHAAVAAHRAGRLRDDDETLVVAQLQPPSTATQERVS